MKIDLINVDKFVEERRLVPITDPILFNKGFDLNPTGLLSQVIFGNDVKSRRETFAYIPLGGHYLTPVVYKLLKRLNRNFEKLILGTANFIIDKSGQIIEDENGESGLEFLYKNWDRLKFTKNKSRVRSDRIDLLTAYSKDEIFITKEIVIPAFYRDVNISTLNKKQKVAPHEINNLYTRLIRAANMITQGSNYGFILNTSRAGIQTTLVEIYDLLKSNIEKKHGLIRKSLMGKSVDYGSRMVISTSVFDVNTPEEMKVDFYHTGVPLAQSCSLFTPFIIHWLRNYFETQVFSITQIPTTDGEIVKLDNPESVFTVDYLKKKIDEFDSTSETRFERILLPTIGSKEPIYLTFQGTFYNPNNPEDVSNKFTREATWTDLLYRAAYEVTKNKAVYVTRFPVTDHFSSFPNLITVLSTHKTQPIMIGSNIYEFYPVIDRTVPKEEVGLLFADTVLISNLYLAGLGGDFDGDQVSVKAVFSQEANEEAIRIMKSKSNLLNILGESNRVTTNESTQALYNLTKFIPAKL